MIGIAGYVTNAIHLVVDVNDPKKPNTLGKDTFFIYLSEKNNAPQVRDVGYKTSACSLTQTTGWYRGGSCTGWVLRHGNMDYLHRELSDDEW